MPEDDTKSFRTITCSHPPRFRLPFRQETFCSCWPSSDERTPRARTLEARIPPSQVRQQAPQGRSGSAALGSRQLGETLGQTQRAGRGAPEARLCVGSQAEVKKEPTPARTSTAPKAIRARPRSADVFADEHRWLTAELNACPSWPRSELQSRAVAAAWPWTTRPTTARTAPTAAVTTWRVLFTILPPLGQLTLGPPDNSRHYPNSCSRTRVVLLCRWYLLLGSARSLLRNTFCARACTRGVGEWCNVLSSPVPTPCCVAVNGDAAQMVGRADRGESGNRIVN